MNKINTNHKITNGKMNRKEEAKKKHKKNT